MIESVLESTNVVDLYPDSNSYFQVFKNFFFFTTTIHLYDECFYPKT